jgi:hypothetical protein
VSDWLQLASFSPDPFDRPSFTASPTPYVLLMAAGFVIGVLGHLLRSRFMVAVGIGGVFLGTFLLPIALFISRS